MLLPCVRQQQVYIIGIRGKLEGLRKLFKKVTRDPKPMKSPEITEAIGKRTEVAHPLTLRSASVQLRQPADS